MSHVIFVVLGFFGAVQGPSVAFDFDSKRVYDLPVKFFAGGLYHCFVVVFCGGQFFYFGIGERAVGQGVE